MPSSLRYKARAVESLADGAARLEEGAPREAVAAARRRGHFRPLEEDALLGWFARLLSLRDAGWELIAEVAGPEGIPLVGLRRRLRAPEDRRLFLVGYAAACVVVRLDRLLVEDVATDRLSQRKLNEGSREHRIPRKQYTAIYEALSLPRNALLMQAGMRVALQERRALRALREDPALGALARRLRWLEAPLDPSRRRYVRLLLGYHRHALRRWGASTRQKTAFGVLESSGRTVAELRPRWAAKRVDGEAREAIRALLRPGDVLVTRHDVAMSNLFLPGYWPHAALYMGGPEDRRRLGIDASPEVARHWRHGRCVLEALKDGVRFRPLEETLDVDAVALLRPELDGPEIARSLARAAPHQGKMYNFDFDFFRADRLVCTEVVYRAYDPELRIPLRERAGRPTLSAEDLIGMALRRERFRVIAVYGAPGCEGRLATGEEARRVLAASVAAGEPGGSPDGDAASRPDAAGPAS